jgi:cytochrome c peroxidase
MIGRHVTGSLLLCLVGLGACTGVEDREDTGVAKSKLVTESILATETSATTCSQIGNRGERLFKCETFGGNGRTCATCHGDATGTFSPEDARALYARDPNAPLFRSIDSDFGLGITYTRLLNDAVIRAGIDLPANVTVVEQPTARTIFLNRGVPTTMNTPALDPVLMSDGRAPDLQTQALGAIHGHAEPQIEPTANQLDAIARYELTLFSSAALRDYASGGPPPTLPPGNTESEKRGRLLFVDGPQGKCALCHSGPMLNRQNAFNTNPGSAFATALVSEFNSANNPVFTFLFTNPDGTVTPVKSPDPGRGLITGNAADALPAEFKIPTLWGISKTAPYFHDNSAKTLEDVGAHYQKFFVSRSITFNQPSLLMSDQERDDAVAYMRLL